MSSTLNTFVPVLTGTNYQQWAAAMQSYLMSQGQWPVTKNPMSSIYTVKSTDAKFDQDKQDKLQDLNDKAVGNICLRLQHTIGAQHIDTDDAFILWTTLKDKYATPGFSQAYHKMKGAIKTQIKDNQDPSPAFDKILTHFLRLKEQDFEIPEKVQVMMIIAKCPPSMETIVQLFTADGKFKDITIEKLANHLRQSWLASTRQGGINSNYHQNQQRANKLSAVKRQDGEQPQFEQQQQQFGGGRGRGTRRGRCAGRGRNQQQQLQQAPVEAAPQPSPPVPANNIAGPSNLQHFQFAAGPSHLGYFASQAAGPALPKVSSSSTYPSLDRAITLARKLEVRPLIETLKTLEMAELAKEQRDPRKRPRTEDNLPRGRAVGLSRSQAFFPKVSQGCFRWDDFCSWFACVDKQAGWLD